MLIFYHFLIIIYLYDREGDVKVNSNDYKSMIGLWKKLSMAEKRRFVNEEVDPFKMGSGLVYCGKSGGGKNTEDEALEDLKREIDKAICYRERPAIDFGGKGR